MNSYKATEDRQILSTATGPRLASKEPEGVFKGTMVNWGDMKARGFVSFCLNRKGLIIQNADPALPKPFCLTSLRIGKAKMIPGPFTQQGWSPDLKLVQMHGGGLPTLLTSPNGLPNRSFLFSSFLSGTSSLFTTASILEPKLFMDCSSCSTRCRRLRETWRVFVSFFLWWLVGFAADMSQKPEIEVKAPHQITDSHPLMT